MGELITASEWKRAALVWAFTYDGRGNPKNLTSAISAKELAGHKISGLKSPQTITKYRTAWKLAIDNGFATDVKPGDLIDLPITIQ